MTEEERLRARGALISGLSVRQLIADLEGKRYVDLVAKHSREAGPLLAATITVHEDLVIPAERDGVRQISADLVKKAEQPRFSELDAADVLSSISCDLNDALFPIEANEAGVFNLFQLITLRLAYRARNDMNFRRSVLG